MSFYERFSRNMSANGLRCSLRVYPSRASAIAAAAAIDAAIARFGGNATVRELAEAGIPTDQLGLAGSASAARYLGAVAGSIAVASGWSLADGSSVDDIIRWMSRNGLNFRTAHQVVRTHRQLIAGNAA